MNKNLLRRIGKKRLRATFAGGAHETAAPRVGGIDETAGVLSGVQICLEGEAKGHGVFLDGDFVAALCEQGNAAGAGLKVRFGHPSMCADALGTFLGRARNFEARRVTRTDGTECWGAFADIALAEEAHNGPGGRDIYAWTLAAAKNNPDTFGQSIVFTYADFFVLDADGGKHLWSAEPGHDSADEDTYNAAVDAWLGRSADGRVFAVLGRLHGTDFTDDPAATDGVFAAFDAADPDTLSEEACDLLDAHPRIVQALAERPEAVAEFVARYNAALAGAGKPAIRLAAFDETVEQRLARLQSAKDQELAALRKELTDHAQKLTGDLEAAQAAASRAEAERESLARDLAEARKQLAQERSNLASVTGAALAHTEAREPKSWEALSAKYGYADARRRFPDVYSKRFPYDNKKG